MRPRASSSRFERALSERLRLWLERGEGGFWLRDAATGEPVRWDDPRLLVLPVAGASYRLDALQDDAFSPGRAVLLVPEPENEHDPNAVGIWDEAKRLQAGYVPAGQTGELPRDARALALWEYRDEEGRRVGLRILVAPADAWIGRPRA